MNARLPFFTKAQQDIRFRPSRPAEHHMRIYAIPLVIGLFFLIFFIRLFQLTIVKGTYYGFIAENNRLREVSIEGQRGTIYDRKGHIIAESTLDTKLDTKTADSENDDPSENSLATDIQSFTREYAHPEALAHVLGYRLIASKEHLEEDACSQPLKLNDKLGVTGVEGLFECHLRPTKGRRLVEVDSMGKAVRTLSQVEPKAGQSIKLSIDSELQARAHEVVRENDIKTSVTVNLAEKKIAVVGLDPHTGEVLLLYSHPTFDPVHFESSHPTAGAYFEDKEKPLFNRALLGTYPPGSVVKPVVAAAALEEEAITESETIEDNGFIDAGPNRFHNWLYTKYGRTDGDVDLRKGLQRSNDIYFYKVGEALTAEKIKSWANTFGYGKHTGIPLDEATGIIPSDFWKREIIGERWFLGDTYNLSIGQGYMLTTPLQVARSTIPFANGGKLCTPRLLRARAHENTDLLDNVEPECISLGLADETMNAVREGMKQACEVGGTGWPFFDFSIADDPEATDSATQRMEVGCKTGTAEAHKVDSPPHAWFTVFAPYEEPEIVLAVLVEESGEGSDLAAPIAKEILKTYFERKE